jgi:hypothetical protein
MSGAETVTGGYYSMLEIGCGSGVYVQMSSGRGAGAGAVMQGAKRGGFKTDMTGQIL